eukprot:Rmarinus@m.24641
MTPSETIYQIWCHEETICASNIEEHELRGVVKTLCNLDFVQKCVDCNRLNTLCRHLELLVPRVRLFPEMYSRVIDYYRLVRLETRWLESNNLVSIAALSGPADSCTRLDAERSPPCGIHVPAVTQAHVRMERVFPREGIHTRPLLGMPLPHVDTSSELLGSKDSSRRHEVPNATCNGNDSDACVGAGVGAGAGVSVDSGAD